MITKLLFSSILILVAFLARIHCRTWLNPQAFAAGVGALDVCVPLLFGPSQVNSVGLLMLSALLLANVAGACVSGNYSIRGVHLGRSAPPSLVTTIVRVARTSSLVAGACGLISVVLVLMTYTTSLSLKTLPLIAHQISLDRYNSGAETAPAYYIVLLSAGLFAAPAFAGILFAVRTNWLDASLGLASIVPAILNVVIQTTKASIAFALVFWVVGYAGMVLALRVLGLGRHIRSTRALWPILALLPILLGVSEFLRVGSDPTLTGIAQDVLSDRNKVSYMGQIAAFSQWFQEYLGSPSNKRLGTMTAAGPSTLLHLSNREQGMYAQSVRFAEENQSSNIYTQYRGLIEDFGPGGALIFQFLSGCAATYYYGKLLRGDLSSLALLSVYYAFYLFYLVSVLSYNTLVLDLFLIMVFWFWFNRKLHQGLVE